MFFDQVGRELGVVQVTKASYIRIKFSMILDQFQDWYKVPRKAVESRGGRGLLNRYRSLAGALQSVYPEYDWQMLSFLDAATKMKNGFWTDPTNLKQFLDALQIQLNIQQVLIHTIL